MKTQFSRNKLKQNNKVKRRLTSDPTVGDNHHRQAPAEEDLLRGDVIFTLRSTQLPVPPPTHPNKNKQNIYDYAEEDRGEDRFVSVSKNRREKTHSHQSSLSASTATSVDLTNTSKRGPSAKESGLLNSIRMQEEKLREGTLHWSLIPGGTSRLLPIGDQTGRAASASASSFVHTMSVSSSRRNSAAARHTLKQPKSVEEKSC